jgi:hypothetical protein
MMIITIVLIWWAIGVWSHVYWLRNQYDYKTNDIPTSLFAGLIGPLSFFVGWTVYGNPSEDKPKTLFRKRS